MHRRGLLAIHGSADGEITSERFRIMRDAQTAKPQYFRTGDGWFAFNLATNLAQM